MIPEKFISRILSQNRIPNPSGLIDSLESDGTVSVRLNPRKSSPGEFLSERVPWTEGGYYLPTRPSFTFDPLFQAGAYYVQESSSMFLEEVLRQVWNEEERPRILDLCGAPGGKSVICSDFAGDSGLVVANEVIRSRAHILAENVTKWGTNNCIVTSSDPSAFARIPGFFDIMVVDAPCSGEGMFRDQTAREQWSEANLLICSERQQRILMDAWSALKQGGYLIYSTCTFNPEENERNMRWLASTVKAQSVRLRTSGFQGVTEVEEDGIFGYYFFPHLTQGDGFFTAVVRKGEEENEYRKEKLQPLFSSPSKIERDLVKDWIVAGDERLVKLKEELVVTHADFKDLAIIYANLGVVKAGTRLATLKGSKAIPSHDLALSNMLARDAFASAGLTYTEAISFFRRDAFTLPGKEKGHLLMTYKEMPIGFANNLGNRINTFIPVELRIRSVKPSEILTDPGIVIPVKGKG